MAREINKASRRGFWLGYMGGVLVANTALLIAPNFDALYEFAYTILVAVICGELTARYHPQFWVKKK